MKQYSAQIIVGILLCVSTAFLSQAAATISRVQTRLDRLEDKVDDHWTYMTTHQVTAKETP